MGDPTHIAILSTGQAAWNAWRAHAPAKPDLTGEDFTGRDLSGYELSHSDLAAAILDHCNLRGANLESATLDDASLVEADLGESRLVGASFDGARLDRARLAFSDLRGASFQRASLVDADLTLDGARTYVGSYRHGPRVISEKRDPENPASGLLVDAFARADLRGAVLPEDVTAFSPLEYVAEISRHARTIFLTVLGASVFCLLTIATTTDVALLVNSATTPLPVIGATVPIAGFHIAASTLLLGLYLYLHLYLQSMWNGLASLPSVFPDGRTLDERAYPWLLTSLVTIFRGTAPRREMSFPWLKFGLSVLIAWFAVPVTIMAFWLRYLPRHELIGAVVLGAMVLVSLLLTLTFLKRSIATLRGGTARITGREIAGFAMALWVVLSVSISSVDGDESVSVLGFNAFLEIPGEVLNAGAAGRNRAPGRAPPDPDDTAESVNLRGANLRFANARAAVFTGVDLTDADFFCADLRDATFIGASVAGAKFGCAKLHGTDLFDSTDASESAKAVSRALKRVGDVGINVTNLDLERADLSGGYLVEWVLAGARLESASIRNATLDRAILDGAILDRSDLNGASLMRARIVGTSAVDASFENANLTDVDFSNSNLSGANLSNAELSGAYFVGTTIDGVRGLPRYAELIWKLANGKTKGTDFRGARLARADLRDVDLTAMGLENADLSFGKLSATRFESADLRGASLRSADLRHASLRRADLRGADLADANLASANLAEADLTGAILLRADLSAADFSNAKGLDPVSWTSACASEPPKNLGDGAFMPDLRSCRELTPEQRDLFEMLLQ